MDGSSSTARSEELAAHGEWLRALARQLVGPADADDAVQEAFEAALRSPPPADRPLRPWLGRVLRNAIKMRWREGSRRTRRERAAELGPSAPAPDELVARGRARELVARLVLELPEAERQALLLRYGEGASAADIARALGVPAGTVRWRLSRALSTLRQRLDAESSGDRRAWQLALAPLAAARSDVAALTTKSALAAGAKGLIAVNTKMLAAAAAATFALGAGATVAYVSRADAPAAKEKTAATAGAQDDAPKPVEASGAVAKDTTDSALTRDQARQRARHAELLARIRAGIERRERERREHERGRNATAPVRAQGEDPVSGPAALQRQYISQAVAEIRPLVRECYTMALERKPDLAGLVAVTFTIAGDEDVGGVIAQSDYDEKKSSIKDPLVAECIQETMYALELPPPVGGGELKVTYPFVFRPDGEPPR